VLTACPRDIQGVHFKCRREKLMSKTKAAIPNFK
jgi:hypothetical protein